MQKLLEKFRQNPASLIIWATVALAVITLIITVVFFAWWALKDQVQFGGTRFDQVAWMKHAETVQDNCKRGEMAYELKSRILARGLRREDVTVLLGRPSLEDDQSMEYDLGKCMHVYHALRIYFDANGRLTNSQISSH